MIAITRAACLVRQRHVLTRPDCLRSWTAVRCDVRNERSASARLGSGASLTCLWLS